MSKKNVNQVLDSDLKRAFKDLQKKKVQFIKQTSDMDAQIDNLAALITYAELTYNVIDTVPPTTNVYNSVGRMFVQTDLEEVKDNINKEFEYASTAIVNFENTKQHLEYIVKEKVDNLRKLVRQRKDRLETAVEEHEAET